MGKTNRKVQTSFFKLVESSSNVRRVFFKKSRFLVFRIWSVFFVFPLFCGRGLGWRIHESVEDTKLSTNKQHSLSDLL